MITETLTKREFLAAMAMRAIIHGRNILFDQDYSGKDPNQMSIARAAVRIADELIYDMN